MLILTRRISEAIRIGTEGEVTVKVLSIRGNHVKLGIDAPQHIAVHREEIFHRKMIEAQIKAETSGEASDYTVSIEPMGDNKKADDEKTDSASEAA